ncbi:anaphase-promoting complex subunit cdc27 [Neonectria magnoliae]|uniref:Anaphase-promoting complex subunit cdc27 n=1 Tax=Neonectria magnoliae TaxID=2732573 RepID=A0ABR1HUR6_9HYPO
MAPNPTAVGGLLRQTIYYHLDNSSYENALFFAERLTAQDPKSSETPYLYALCHLRLGDYRSAYDVSKPMGYRGVHLGCAWVFAQACMALERHKDGITALEKSRGLWSSKTNMGKHSATSRAGLPDAPAVLCLLGKLHRDYDDKKKAISCFEEALKLNPLMWDAFTALCDMGVAVRVPNIFRVGESLLQNFDLESSLASESRDGSSSNSLDAPSKRSQRHAITDLGNDPFNANVSPTIYELTNGDAFGDAGDNSDFMTKIQAARIRNAALTSSNTGSDGMETPPGPSQTAEVPITRVAHPHEAPHAPSRRARNAHTLEQGQEAPPRMNYRLTSKRSTRAQEKGHDQGADPMMTDAPNPPTSTIRSAIPGVERKRTVSGHPVPRSGHSEEAGTRRSARLNLFKSTTRANSGPATIGASAGRELKKARPPISSRIVRPGSSGSNVGRVVSGNRKPLEDAHVDADHGEMPKVKEAPPQPVAPKTTELDTIKQEEALKWILDLTKKFATGYYAFSQFQCQDSLQAFMSLPPAHQNTPWVLAQMGRAHYEQASYVEAEKFFRRMRVQAPSRLEDMEVYSTILWHLRRETDLSFLAHELVDSSWHSPQAWCALGNAWSLARDHEQALRCFKRATQLDPKFAYAFTLQGHEHFTNEEYEKALTAYRQAISADKRHYNAYYGIGRVQERLGAYDKAYTHFHAAQIINPHNTVLICCMGTILERQKQIMPALQAYSKAVELAPRAADVRYKKARALLAVGQLEAAQKELIVLRDLAPDEATVHFLLGRLYRRTGEKQLSVRHFTIALALDPKAGQQIKEAIESFEDDVAMDDSMMA